MYIYIYSSSRQVTGRFYLATTQKIGAQQTTCLWVAPIASWLLKTSNFQMHTPMNYIRFLEIHLSFNTLLGNTPCSTGNPSSSDFLFIAKCWFVPTSISILENIFLTFPIHNSRSYSSRSVLKPIAHGKASNSRYFYHRGVRWCNPSWRTRQIRQKTTANQQTKTQIASALATTTNWVKSPCEKIAIIYT